VGKLALARTSDNLLAAQESGCSSVVERNLAKVDVDSSNLFSRSILLLGMAKEPGQRIALPELALAS
jgi:hypothetical protein